MSRQKPIFRNCSDLKCSICSNQVKGEAGEADKSTAMTQLLKIEHDMKNENRCTGQYSLLLNNFRKPATVTSQSIKNSKAIAVYPRRGKVVKKEEISTGKANPQTITHSRMNLLRALSKVKNGQEDNGTGYSDDKIARYARSDEDCSDKSSSNDGMDQFPKKASTRKRRSPNGMHSEESSDGDYMKFYPALPIEPPPKKEFNQEEFLSLFNLITPEVAESLKLRRSERKRRNCTKNEKNDFHYGKFDLNEVGLDKVCPS